MSEKIWHILLVIVVVGKIVEYTYKIFRWYKSKKNKNSTK